MSDVTGNIGSESVRLRGMALELTQEQILDQLRALNQKQGADTSNLNAAATGLAAMAGGLAGQQGSLNKFGAAIKAVSVAGDKLGKVLGEGLAITLRTIRGLDSNVGDASWSMRQLAGSSDNAAARILRFGADSVSQLQEQFEVYKRLSNVGGAFASDFDNLRVNASRMGITMQEYTGLIEENFINLRMGGKQARNAMRDLQISVDEIKDSDLAYTFQRAGIDQSRYGKLLLQSSSIYGGLNRAQEKYGSEFTKAMAKSILSSYSLADAFGLSRDKMMEGIKQAREDAMFNNFFESIADPAKEAMYNTFFAMTGDVEKAKQLTVSKLTGIPTTISTEIAAMGGQTILDAVEKVARSGTEDERKANFMALQKVYESFAKTYGGSNLARFFAKGGTDFGREAMALLLGNFQKMPKTVEEFDAMMGVASRQQESQLDTLGEVQRKNIEMATAAAIANKSLNRFGLTVAKSSQVLSSVIVAMGRMVSSGIGNSDVFKTMIADLEKLTDKIGVETTTEMAASIAKELGINLKEAIKDSSEEYKKATSNATPARQPVQPSEPAIPLTGPMANTIFSRSENGKRTAVSAGNLNKVLGEKDKVSPAMQYVLGSLSQLGNLSVNKVNANLTDKDKANWEAVDFDIEGSNRDALYKQLTSKFKLIPGRDFRMPATGGSPTDLRLEFSKQGLEKIKANANNAAKPEVKSNTGPGGASKTNPQSNAKPTTSTSQSSVDLPKETALAASTSVNTAQGDGQRMVNNNTTTVVATLDPDFYSEIVKLNSNMVSVKNAVEELKNPLKRVGLA